MGKISASTACSTTALGHLGIVGSGDARTLGLPGWFEDDRRFASIRGATSYASALALFGIRPPDVAIVTCVLPDARGIEAAGTLKALWPEVGVLLYGAAMDQLPEAIASGIDGFYLDAPDPGDLLRGIIAIRAGRVAMDRRLRNMLFTLPTLNVEG